MIKIKEVIDLGENVEIVAEDTDTKQEYRAKEKRWVADAYIAPGELEAHQIDVIQRAHGLPLG